MYAWYRGQSAKYLVRTMFHVHTGFEVPFQDVLVNHAPLPRVLWSGFVGGLLMWSIPLVIYVLYLLFNMLFIFVGFTGYRLPILLAGIPETLLGVLPYIVVTGLVGVGLAWLRRVSAVGKRHFRLMGMRLGFNTVVATLIGLIWSVLYVEYMIFFGPFLFIAGFLYDGVWEACHDIALARSSASDKDHLLAREVRKYLTRHPHLGGFELEDVRIENGKATITGTWANSKVREEVQETLRHVEGISSVFFERAEAPAS